MQVELVDVLDELATGLDRSFEISSSDSSSLGQGSFSKLGSATGTPCSCTVTTSGNVDAYRKFRA